MAEYTRVNLYRMQRPGKTMKLLLKLAAALQNLNQELTWVILTVMLPDVSA